MERASMVGADAFEDGKIQVYDIIIVFVRMGLILIGLWLGS